MKIIPLILLFIISTDSLSQANVNCEALEKCISLIFKAKNFKHFLQPSDPKPYQVQTLQNCSYKNKLIEISSVNEFKRDHPIEDIMSGKAAEIQVTSFKQEGNVIFVGLFYPSQGASFSCYLKKKRNAKYKIIKVSWIEL
jgi:hypothetical protein